MSGVLGDRGRVRTASLDDCIILLAVLGTIGTMLVSQT